MCSFVRAAAGCLEHRRHPGRCCPMLFITHTNPHAHTHTRTCTRIPQVLLRECQHGAPVVPLYGAARGVVGSENCVRFDLKSLSGPFEPSGLDLSPETLLLSHRRQKVLSRRNLSSAAQQESPGASRDALRLSSCALNRSFLLGGTPERASRQAPSLGRGLEPAAVLEGLKASLLAMGSTFAGARRDIPQSFRSVPHPFLMIPWTPPPGLPSRSSRLTLWLAQEVSP